jgi:hypothetical protein
MYEYGYTPTELAQLTPFQLNFLAEWLGWYWRKQRLKQR